MESKGVSNLVKQWEFRWTCKNPRNNYVSAVLEILSVPLSNVKKYKALNLKKLHISRRWVSKRINLSKVYADVNQ